MKSTLFEQTRNLYQNLDMPNNEICENCEANIKSPLLPWHIGENYHENGEKLLIVGKPHRGKPGIELSTGLLDARDLANDLFQNSPWAFWSYTREILNQVYGESSVGWQNISLLNAVKCTSTLTTDKTTRQTAISCVKELEVLPREISILKPSMIIFFTWHFQKDLFFSPFLAKDFVTNNEVTSRETRVVCKNKKIGWWHREFSTTWCDKLPVLIVSHPERKAKSEYCSLLANWIKLNANN